MRSKKALKNISVSLLLQIVMILCGFIIPRMIIQTFGSNVNGLIASITQFLGYITLLEVGVGPVIKSTLYKPIANKDKKQIANILKASEKFFRKIAYIFIIYLIVLCIGYVTVINDGFDKLFTVSLILIISISTFAEYYFGMTYKLFLQAEQETYIVSGIQIVTTIANTIMVIVLIKLGANIQSVKLISAFIFIFRPILQNLYVKKKYKINFREVDNQYKLKQKWDGLAQHIAYIVHSNTDIAVLTCLSTMEEISVYSVYLLVVNGIKNLVQAFKGGIDDAFGDMIAKEEKNILNINFKIYELFYYTIITIMFIATFLLIVPFINVYTKGITDTNYYRPTFGSLIVLSEFIWAIRQPYNDLIRSAGHFKETMKGAWIEAGTNIIISVILVFKFGIVGVAIGTLIAMFIRGGELIYHSSKYILERKILETIKRVIIVIIEFSLILIIFDFMPKFNISDYSVWVIEAIIVTIVTAIIVITINCIVYKEDTKKLMNIIKSNIIKNK